MSDYIQSLRTKVGHDLLLVTSVTIVVFDDAGCVLLARHHEGDVWVLPGGGIEPPESPADAAVREMWEETGLWVELVRVLGVYGGADFLVTYINGDQVAYQMMVFEGRVIGGTLRPDDREIKATAYVSQAEWTALPTTAWMWIVMPDVFQRNGQACFQKPRWQPPVPSVRKGGMSDYVRQLRGKVGNSLVLTPCVWGFVFDEERRLLLQKRADNGRWAGPAGAIDPENSPTDAVVREAWEETGVIVEPVCVLAIFGGAAYAHTFDDGDQIINYGVIFECRCVGGHPTPDGIESTAVDFFPLMALPTELMSPRWRKLIPVAAENRTVVDFELPTWRPPT